ncbi:hypothetical protein DHEL01_v207693 [Diaporthe helianthi]|uniref:Uncharacterized protein n=1 Tax=Diaporthe helianthi TaxID=158607 RepID=A0A2P5HUH9_DIAHE|nr:hypothetical protein DHEL01_v207693 [Diaporthe helianthi]
MPIRLLLRKFVKWHPSIAEAAQDRVVLSHAEMSQSLEHQSWCQGQGGREARRSEAKRVRDAGAEEPSTSGEEPKGRNMRRGLMIAGVAGLRFGESGPG